MNTRIQQFLTAENLSQTMFADTLGVSRATISNIVAGRSRPGYDFFTSLMQHYPSLNIEWVLTGRGKMYKDATKNAEKESSGTLSPFGGDPESEDEGDALSFTAQNAAQRLQKAQDEREPKLVSSQMNDPEPPARTARRIVKVVVFFDDNTFTELT